MYIICDYITLALIAADMDLGTLPAYIYRTCDAVNVMKLRCLLTSGSCSLAWPLLSGKPVYFFATLKGKLLHTHASSPPPLPSLIYLFF